MNLEDGAPKNRVIIIAISIALVFLIFALPAQFTGFAVYSVTEETADGENTTFENATMSSGNYLDTQNNDASSQTLSEVQEGSVYILKWNYDFNTTYNISAPVRIDFFLDVRPFEKINLSIYNFTGSSNYYINETSGGAWQVITGTIFQNPDLNLSHFVNNNNQIKIVIEDTDKTDNLGHTVQIDYLAINVTVSPLYDLGFLLVNSTGDSVGNGKNFTRSESGLNASALWNASGVNASYAWLNASGTVSEAQFPHYDSNYNWTNYTLEFDNYTLFPTAGNVSVRLKAYDDFYQQNYTHETRYFCLWSNASVSNISVNESAYDDNITIANGTAFAISCLVTDYFSSESIAGHNVSFHVNHGYIGSALSNSSGWASHTHTDASAGDADYDVRCNITDEPGVYYYRGPYNSSNETVHVIGDGDKPYFIENWFEHNGQRINETGFHRNASIVLNVTDDTSYVSSATAQVTFSGSTDINHTMTQGQDGLWRFEFDGSGLWKSLNESITVTFYYMDAGGNLNSTDPAGTNALSINWTMHINLTHWEGNDTLYNRGENLTFHAYDVNWFLYEDVNWSLEVLKYNGSANESWSGEDVTHFNYTLNASAPPGNWTVWANASHMGNNGSAAFAFNVTDVLDPFFHAPSAGSVYQPSQDITNAVKVRVNYGRGGLVPWNLTVNLTCTNPGGVFTLVRSGDDYVLNDTCMAPEFYSTGFQLTANFTCPYNNTNMLESISLSTADEDDGNGGSPSSSPSSSSYVTPTCNCTEWEDMGCGSGNCTEAQMYQERVCTPAGCETEERCIKLAQCTDIKNFNVTAVTDVVEVTQGKNGTALFTVENTGNKDFELVLNFAEEPFTVFPEFDSFELPQKSQVSVPIVVHASLSQEPGEYVITVKFTEKEFEKMQSIRILVNENDMLRELEDLNETINTLSAEAEKLSGMGIDVTDLLRRIEEANTFYQKAEAGIPDDDLEAVDEAYMEVSIVMEDINSLMLQIRIQGFFLESRYNIIAAFTLFILMLYVLLEVIRPPLTLGRRIRKLEKRLKDVDEARKETERQWTQRKIDDTAFRNLIQKRKDEKNMITSELKRLREESEIPVQSKLSPVALGRWVSAGPRKLFRRNPKEKKPEKNKPELKSKKPEEEKSSGRMADFQKKYLEAKKKQEEMDRR